MTEHIWTRREGESSVAHDAFKIYLHLGKNRSTRAVAEECSKNESLMKRWSSEHDWPARSVAYDSYVLEAATDGEIHLLAECRDKNLALMDKLRTHLSNRLDHFIQRNEDPSVRWTQALTAMAKVEQNSLLLKDDVKTTEKLDHVMELVAKVVENAGKVRA